MECLPAIRNDLDQVEGLLRQGLKEANPAESSVVANQVVNIVQSSASQGKNINIVVQEVVVQQVIFNLTMSLLHVERIKERLSEIEKIMERQKEVVLSASAGPVTLLEAQKREILKALKIEDWIQQKAAIRLGISPRALIYKIEKFGITHHKWRANRAKEEA